jgi:adenine nucleotide transporter 17
MVGGVTAISAFYPLNNIRSRLQVDDSIKLTEEEEKNVLTKIPFISMFFVADKIVKKYGLYGLFQGWWSSVVSLGASNFVYFYVYNAFKVIYQVKILGSRKKSIDPISNLIVAALAGVINVFITTPLWVAGFRLSVQDAPNKNAGHGGGAAAAATTTPVKPGEEKEEPYTGVWDALTRISQKEGFLSLWKGVGPSLMLVSNPSIQFVVYERLRLPLEKAAKAKGTSITNFQFFIIGAIAKAVATVVTYPIQLAQSKLRNDKSDKPPSFATVFKSTFDLLTDIYTKLGFFALFKGMEAKLWQTVLTAAFQFQTYERTHKLVMSIMMPDHGTVKKVGGH